MIIRFTLAMYFSCCILAYNYLVIWKATSQPFTAQPRNQVYLTAGHKTIMHILLLVIKLRNLTTQMYLQIPFQSKYIMVPSANRQNQAVAIWLKFFFKEQASGQKIKQIPSTRSQTTSLKVSITYGLGLLNGLKYKKLVTLPPPWPSLAFRSYLKIITFHFFRTHIINGLPNSFLHFTASSESHLVVNKQYISLFCAFKII